MPYKIINCKSYKSDKTVEKEWFEVQYLSNVRKWWFFGERVWKTYKEEMYSYGGPFYVNMKFRDEMEAREFINRCESGLPNDRIERKEVWKLI